jgi:hypothetical protein
MRWSGRIFWLLAFEEVESLWLRVERKKDLSGPSTLNPHPSTNLHLLPAFTLDCSKIGHGKSYPVTAALLLPNVHGISRADPRIKLAKNCKR